MKISKSSKKNSVRMLGACISSLRSDKLCHLLSSNVGNKHEAHSMKLLAIDGLRGSPAMLIMDYHRYAEEE